MMMNILKFPVLTLLIAAPSMAQQVPLHAETRPQAKMRSSPPAPSETPAPEEPRLLNDRFVRARENLIALREGRISVSDLTPVELQDVVDFDRMLRGDSFDNRSPRQKCVDEEIRRAGGSPSQLAWNVIRLKCR